MFKEFKKFAMRGNVIDMAVGIIVGAAFGTIVKSLVDDVLTPPIGLLLGGVDFGNLFIVLKQGATPGPYAALADAKAAGAVTVNYGVFLNDRLQLLDRRLRRLLAGARHQRDAPQAGGGAGRADDQGVPSLRVGDPAQGHPLPALHLAARRVERSRYRARWARIVARRGSPVQVGRSSSSLRRRSAGETSRTPARSWRLAAA